MKKIIAAIAVATSMLGAGLTAAPASHAVAGAYCPPPTLLQNCQN